MMKYQQFLLFCLIVFTSFNCLTIDTKNEVEVNTLKNQAADDTMNANEFLDKYEYLKALEYFNKALNNNIKADNISGIVKSYTDIGRVYLLLSQYDNAIENFQKAIEILYEEKNLDIEQAYVFNGLGEAYYYKNKFNIAEDFFNDALKLEILLHNEENQALIIQNLAKIKRSKGEYDKALEQFLIVAGILERLYTLKKIINVKNLSLIYYAIGQTYSKLNKYPKAIEYIKKALIIDKKIENVTGIADDYYALGALSEKTNLPLDEIIKYYKKSLNIYNIIGDLTQYIEISNVIAGIYYQNDKLKDYYEYKNRVFLGTVDIQKKKNIQQEILKMLHHEKINDFFTPDEQNVIRKKYSNEIK